MIDCVHRQFNPVRNTQFLEDSSQVVFDRVFADLESLRYVSIDLTFHNRSDDVQLTPCQG
jgi:hypothetical protein